MIQDGRAPKEDRLWLLTDIAEEAQRLKLGGEDKIRVACQAADNLKATRPTSAPSPAPSPYSTPSSSIAPPSTHTSPSARTCPPPPWRPAAAAAASLGSIMTNPDPSPAKRKRVRDDDADAGGTYRTPKKPGGADGNPRARPNARAKKSVPSLTRP